MKLSLSSPPSRLFGVYAAAPAGEAGERPMRVKACSHLTEKPWRVRRFYYNTNHGNHFTSLSEKLFVRVMSHIFFGNSRNTGTNPASLIRQSGNLNATLYLWTKKYVSRYERLKQTLCLNEDLSFTISGAIEIVQMFPVWQLTAS